jgi:hypothetical protein
MKQTIKERWNEFTSILFGNSHDVSIEDVAFCRKRYSIFRFSFFIFLLILLNASEEAEKIATIGRSQCCGIG